MVYLMQQQPSLPSPPHLRLFNIRYAQYIHISKEEPSQTFGYLSPDSPLGGLETHPRKIFELSFFILQEKLLMSIPV